MKIKKSLILKLLSLVVLLFPTANKAAPTETLKDLSEATIQEELINLKDNEFVIFSDSKSTNLYIQASLTGEVLDLEAVSEKYSSPKISEKTKEALEKMGWVESKDTKNYAYAMKSEDIKNEKVAKFIIESFKSYNIEPGADIKISKDSF